VVAVGRPQLPRIRARDSARRRFELAFLLAAFWGLGLITSMSASSTVSLLVLAALVIVGVGLMLSVALFNRPKSFVPPKLREQPGAWHEISAARRAQQR
jgi:hypothetical protein